MVGDMMNIQLTEREIELIELAIAEQILKAKQRIEEEVAKEMYKGLKDEYIDLLDTIFVAKKCFKTIDKRQ